MTQFIEHYPIDRLYQIFAAWNFQFFLIEICSRYDFDTLRTNIKKLIGDLTEAEKLQDELRVTLDMLSPITNQYEPFNLFSVDQENISLLKRILPNLNQSRGKKSNKLIFTKAAYFELFFIAESLGLQKPNPTKSYQSNDLISFVRIITHASASDEANRTLSEYHQKYTRAKQSDSSILYKIKALIDESKLYQSNDCKWSPCVRLVVTSN